jgi:hypothetical protein
MLIALMNLCQVGAGKHISNAWHCMCTSCRLAGQRRPGQASSHAGLSHQCSQMLLASVVSAQVLHMRKPSLPYSLSGA